MKRMVFILAALMIIFVFAQVLMSHSNKKIENPNYVVLKDFGEFEVRQYDSMIMANTPLNSNNYEQNASDGFRRVAAYIFGQNEKEEKIAMTSPVFMEMGSTPSMSFVMPKQYKKELAKNYIKNLLDKKTFKEITTTLEPFSTFYPAEAYHQDFEKRNPDYPYVKQVSIPRLKAFKNKTKDLLKKKP